MADASRTNKYVKDVFDDREEEMMRFFAYLSLLAISSAVHAAVPTLVPQPAKMEAEEGSFPITAETRIVARGAARFEATKLAGMVERAMGCKLRLEDASLGENLIVLGLEKELGREVGTEGYLLNVAPTQIDIRAAAPAGLYYGIETRSWRGSLRISNGFRRPA